MKKRSRSDASLARSSPQPRLRCAVYTRKSTEEGLDQEFNSLDAQREACAAFVTSQVGLGWKLLPERYDDGGISGGTMERPALQRLLQDIRDCKVDVVVVYKIDRLTRSLADFAKIVEVFDGASVSFVSVTQQFNTTTSMGRLTLNVLLSFAQFEREVTAERIRDKIAASRKKGMWMGGRIPLGYTIVDRKLVVEPMSAEIVRAMFTRLLELGSIGALLAELRHRHPNGIYATVDVGNDGHPRSDELALSLPSEKPRLILMTGAVTYLLRNPIYIGKVRHHDALHDGEHDPIVDLELFNCVQNLLERSSRPRRALTITKHAHLLNELLFDETGDRLVPSTSCNHGKRYRYYISSRLSAKGQGSSTGWRLPADEIENLAIRQAIQVLRDQKLISEWISAQLTSDRVAGGLHRAADLASTAASASPSQKRQLLMMMFQRITITPNKIVFAIDTAALVEAICSVDGGGTGAGFADTNSSVYIIERLATISRRAPGARIIVEGEGIRKPDENLVDLVGRANVLLSWLTDGSSASIKELASKTGVHRADISRVLPLAFLAPSIVEQILTGSQPANLTPAYLRRGVDIPADWAEQTALARR